MPQGMAGMNLFDTFEEEHMETPAIPRYNTREPEHASTLSIRIILLNNTFSYPLTLQAAQMLLCP
jgi:hypothetical protein